MLRGGDQPGMSIERHSRTRRIELGRSLLGRRKIYLDACFWIALRDVAAGTRTGGAERKLLHHLRRGVSSGRLVCPISTDMLMELMKQPNTPGRRQGTAVLIDELSLGVSAMDPPTLLGTEIHHFLLTAKGGDHLHPMQELIWTKVAYAMGDVYPTFENLSDDVQLELQRRTFDHLWERPLLELAGMMGGDSEERRGFEELTSETNANNWMHRDQLRSLEHAYDVELRGGVEFAGGIAADVITELASRDAGCRLTPTPEERAASVNQCRNLLYEAMRKPEHRSALRTLHVKAAIHAGMRWDKQRKFKVNDWHDFGHATIALTYCDAFLTEGPLHHLVTTDRLNLESVNGCKVASEMQDAVDLIRTL